ncbi:MAG: hypothetical protein NT178_09120 [Proteobacteria bacterium]|nr:hypothetical protein [Pseudomonadota bacterium]
MKTILYVRRRIARRSRPPQIRIPEHAADRQRENHEEILKKLTSAAFVGYSKTFN